jgi:hypothetical protein
MEDLLALMRFNPPITEDTDVAAVAAAHYAILCKKWAAEKAFLAYFKSEWWDKLGEKSIVVVISLNSLLHPYYYVTFNSFKRFVTKCCAMAEMIMQIFRTTAGCPINTTSHIEGYHGSLKVLKPSEL